MTIENRSRVGQLAAEYPLATRVFHRHGIDFCCHGGRELQDVCEARGLTTEEIVQEIRQELEAAPTAGRLWNEAPLGELIDHILATYHQSLREELPRLEEMARKVNKVHGPKHPGSLPELLTVYLGLKAELEQHMLKEEQVLFPMIKRGHGAMTGGPVSVMEQEHESAGKALERLRELTEDYTVPEHACNTWRALWHGLAALEESLHQHIHLENNILFPRALEV